jgi:hypothetical protein
MMGFAPQTSTRGIDNPVTHSSSVYLIDRAVYMRLVHSFGMLTSVITDDIGVLLASD